VFAHFPPDAGVRREICLCLARTAEGGGSAGVTAGRELLVEISIAQRLFEKDDDEQDDDEQDDDDFPREIPGGSPGCGVGWHGATRAGDPPGLWNYYSL